MKSEAVSRDGVAIPCERLRNIAPWWGKEWGKIATLCSALALTLLTFPALAEPGWKAIDGDTVIAPDGRRVRVVGVDTAEKACRCAQECQMAAEATDFTQRALNGARQVTLEPIPRKDRYGRVLAVVRIDGRDLAALLIENQLGRAYDGGRRKGWCE